MQRIKSELVLGLAVNGTGEAAKMRAALGEIEKGLKSIGERREAEARLTHLTAASEKARVKVRDLANELAAADKPTKKLQNAYDVATAATDRAAKALEKQRGIVAAAEAGYRKYVGTAETAAQAQSRLGSEAERQSQAIQRAVEGEARAQRMRRSLLKEMERDANEQARINRQIAEDADRARARADRAAVEDAKRRRDRIERERRAAIAAEGYTRGDANRRAAEAAAAAEEERRTRRRTAAGIVAGAAGVRVGQAADHLASGALHTYREFDDLRRYQKAILGLTDEEQKPFVDQAIRMGSKTRFNDLQVLEAQLSLAQRGVKRDFIRPFVEESANYAMAMGTSLPDAATTLEGIIFGTGKHIENPEEALKTMRRTVDFSVKLAKIGGLNDNDIKEFFKFGGMPGSTVGFSDEYLGAMAALMRRANISGSEAGVATRSAAAHLVSPTADARVTLAELGIDYGKFVKSPAATPESFEAGFKEKFGKGLSAAALDKVKGIISNPELVEDRGAFTAALNEVLRPEFLTKKGKIDANAAKAIAKFTAKYYDTLATSTDVEGLMTAILAANPSLNALNKIFTEKHGGKFSKLRDVGLLMEYINSLKHAPEGFAGKIADERQGGYAGARARLEGSAKNLETATGRAWDSDGQGGLLTKITDTAANLVQHLAELDPKILAFGSGLGLLAGKIAEFSGAWSVVNNLLEFRAAGALTGSAGALNASAAALDRAAAALSMRGGAATAPVNTAATAGAATAGATAAEAAATATTTRGIVGRFLAGAMRATSLLAPLMILRDLGEAHRPTTPENYRYTNDVAIDAGQWERSYRAQRERQRDPEAARGRQMSGPEGAHGAHWDGGERSIWSDPAATGQGAGEALGKGVADGLGKQSSLIEEQARQILATVTAVLAQGVTMPIRVEQSGSVSAPAAPRQSADRGPPRTSIVENRQRSGYADTDYS